jgi:tight adherence protein C
MTWLLAACYVGAGWLLLAGVSSRIDPGLRERLAAGRPSIGSVTSRLGRLGLSQFRALGGLAGAVIGLAGWSAGLVVTSATTAVLAAAGWRLPDVILARRASSLRRRMSAFVPDLLDLVAVSVTAGLSPRLALERAPETVGGPLGEELARASRAVALGATWREELRGVADRVRVPELRRLALVLERSRRLGAPVSERLRILAREVRAERRLQREERARRAPVVMLFPLVFLILPAFVLAAVVPALLVATHGLP